MNRRRIPELAAVLLSVLVFGCAVLDTGHRGERAGEFLNPAWNLPLMTEHLNFFQDIADTDSFDETARYMADRMRQYRVQPGIGGMYNVRSTGSILAIGLVGGRNPQVADEAVLVTANMADPVASAAWLELARVQAAFSRSGILPERTVIFAAWKGAEDGLRSFLQTPTWPRAEITAWIHLHPASEHLEAFRESARNLSWRYHMVLPELQAATEMRPEESRRLAERAHANIRAEVHSEGWFLPIRPDVLVAPPETENNTLD